MSGFIELPKRKFDQSRECTFSRPFQIRLQCPALGRARKSVQAFRYRSKNLPLFRWRTLETELDWLALGSLELSFCSLRIRLPNLTGMSNFFPFGPEPFQILPLLLRRTFRKQNDRRVFPNDGLVRSHHVSPWFHLGLHCASGILAQSFQWLPPRYIEGIFSTARKSSQTVLSELQTQHAAI